MPGKMMTKIAAVAVAGALLGAMSANAANYLLEAGQSETLSTAAQYDSMAVNGDLTVSGGIAIKSPTINMAGGSITVLGANTTIGEDLSGDSTASTRTTLSMTNGTDGAYGMLRSHGGGVASGKGLAIYELYVRKEGSDFVSDNGCFDFMSISNGTVNMRSAYNYSSFTGRIAVAGTSAFYRRSDRGTGGIFVSGAYKIDLQDDATLTFNFGNQGGSLNNEDCVVDIGGTGTVRVVGSHENEKYIAKINRGAYINHSGPLLFVRTDANRNCRFGLDDSSVIGPNVTALQQTSGNSSYLTSIAIDSDSTITLCGDVEITGTRAYLTGGRIKIDATAANRLFKCNINEGDPLVVEKTGANEMIVSSTTNIPNLVVSAGTVRFTEACVVGALSAATNTAIVADGCEVTLPSVAELVGVAFETANGGRFVFAGSSQTVIYNPESIPAAIHVADGSLVFSKYGFSQKHWRWTFTKVANSPGPLKLGRLWIFGSDGETVTPTVNADYMTYKEPNSDLTPGTVCFCCDSSTNVTTSSGDNYERLKICFRSSFAGLKYFPDLISPVIDPGNAASHLGVELYLKGDAKPVTGYNIMIAPTITSQSTTVNDYPVSWKVEASEDGETWTEIETRTDEIPQTPKTYRYFDGETASTYSGYSPVQERGKPFEYFHFTGYRVDGLEPLDEPMSLQVDDGAEIDLRSFTGGQAVNALTIDLSAGGGTIHGGAITANGTLAIKNAAVGNLFAPMPLTFDGTSDISNLASWSVVVDGVAKQYKIAVEGEAFRLQPPGLIIIFQ